MSEPAKPVVDGLHHQSTRDYCARPTDFFAESNQEGEQVTPRRFERQAAQYPNRIAVKTTREVFTYDQLNKAANRAAQAIAAQRGREQEPVAILLESNAQAIIAMLGVLKSHKFYVLLKPSHPDARNRYIFQHIQPRLIVTNSENLSLAIKLAQGDCQLLNMDELGPYSTDSLAEALSPDDLAYVIYTSGSVGQPKGIIHSHRTALHFRKKGATRLEIGDKDRVTPIGLDVFTPLISGAACFPWNITKDGLADLARWLMEQEITVYRSFPTAFRHFVGTLTGKEDFPKLRLISLIGEPLYRNDVQLFKRYFPASCLLINNLGSTETGTFSQYVIDRNTEITGNIVPVGYQTEDVEVLLLDDGGKEVGVDAVGEIAVKSRYLSLGYWPQPDLTQSNFREPRLYFTGDLGRMSEDGCLDCLGRKDFQVKIRSLRVDTREVEAVLLDHPAIKATTIAARESASGDMRLIAYFVARTEPPPTVSQLRNFLKEKISDHMIPSAFVKLEALPLTATGKVDRRALPDPGRPDPM
jgi:amino acid adenylation domain-containing protein